MKTYTHITLTRKITVLIAILALLAVPLVALADDISNNLDASIDAVAEVMSLNVGGANGTTQLYVTPRNGDGKQGCNLTGSTTLVISIVSNDTSVATVSPAQVTFTSCGDTPTLTVAPHNQGSATINASLVSNNTGGSFNLAPVTFTVNVAPPPNTPPTVVVAGVTGGASYPKGSVPAATCEVTDAEDGNSSFPATLSAITGPYASDGIGEQTASCSYTDGGGLTASASMTYGIVDPSAPNISYVLTPASPDGNNGWYKSNVTLMWNVSDAESPNSLHTTGCDNQNITSDQIATTYSCSATSAGGSTGPVEVTIKRDATAPSVTATPDRADDHNGWYNHALTFSFSGNDATSDKVTCDAPLNYSGPDDATASVSGTCTDEAGNTGTGSFDFKYDATAPTGVALAVTAGTLGANGWYISDVTVSTSGSDDVSSVSCTADQYQTTDTASATFNGSCTNDAGLSTNAAPLTIKRDATPPGLTWNGGPANGGTYYFGFVPAAPTCTASDALSGPNGCNVTGYDTAIGSHTMTATAKDMAGNSKVETRTYTIQAWTLSGFYQPVDMPTPTTLVYNTVKNGSTVPFKFEIFAGPTELTDVADVKSLTYAQTTCDANATTDDIETTATGGTSLRYDTTAGQFVYNWKTPSTAGKCYRVTMTTLDGSSLVAYFKLK
jgi:hypothetical protein